MIKGVKCAFLMIALTVSVSCTHQIAPASPPPPAPDSLHIYHTRDTMPLIAQTGTAIYERNNNVVFDFAISNHEGWADASETPSPTFLVTHHAINTDSSLWSAPLVRDGLVLIVHPDNPVSNLSIEQARRIYRGQTQNWADLGGYDDTITVYSRELGAGLRLEFERLVMGQQQTTPNAQVLSSSMQMFAQIARDRNSIGYVPLSLLDAQSVQPLAVETILPSLTTIADNRYPLRSTVYVVGLNEPTGVYRDFFLHIQREETQTALSSIYAPLPR
ncbi:MAG: substrate-binding domain-containing protein [Chloroflexota bacterium]